MGTRAQIGVTQPNGTVRSIYVHWDGYLEGAGATLLRSYNDPSPEGDALRTALLDLGSLSSLGDKLVPDPGRPHSFDDPQVGVCVAYHRDRKEGGGPRVSVHGKDNWPDTWQVCEYLWEAGAWLWRHKGVTGHRWQPLALAL